MRRVLIVTWLTIGLTAFGSPSVRAEMQDFQRIKAKKLEAQARVFYGTGKFVEAANSFRAAFNANSDARYIFNVGKCYERLNDPLEAANYYRRYLELVPNAKDRKSIEETIRKLQYQSKSDWARLTILTQPVGANVYLDDRGKGVIGITPFTRSLPPGRYKVLIDRKGHDSASLTLTLAKQQSRRLSVVLKPHLGYLRVSTDRRKVRMILDGIELASVPKSALRLKTGVHYLLVEKKNHRPVFRRVKIEREKTEQMKIKLDRLPIRIKHSTYWPWAWASTSIGVAALVTGMTFSLLAKGDQDRANSFDKTGSNASRDKLDSIRSSARKKALVGNILLGVGGAAVITGAVLFVLDWRDMKQREEKLFSETIRIQPLLARDGAGILWSMSY